MNIGRGRNIGCVGVVIRGGMRVGVVLAVGKIDRSELGKTKEGWSYMSGDVMNPSGRGGVGAELRGIPVACIHYHPLPPTTALGATALGGRYDWMPRVPMGPQGWSAAS